jgi:hypothetical protein
VCCIILKGIHLTCLSSAAGGRSGRLSGPGRVDRVFRTDGLRGRGPFSGRGSGGRVSGQEYPSRGRGVGSAPLRSGSGNSGGSSSNNGSFTSTVAAGSGLDNNRREIQGVNANRAARRGAHQIPRNGAVLQGSPPVAAV